MQKASKVITINKHGSGEPYYKTLCLLCGDGMPHKSMIDLCCGETTHTRHLPFRERVYVDVVERNMGPSQPYFVKTDVLSEHPVFDKHYDVALCMDGIEHLTKEQGMLLLERMKKISDRQILFTPLHEWMMEPHNPSPESHKCLWTPDDLLDWAHIVMPVYHEALGIGAFFFWNCQNLDDDFIRVRKELHEIW
jgi:hypothetical protein